MWQIIRKHVEFKWLTRRQLSKEEGEPAREMETRHCQLALPESLQADLILFFI